MSCSRRFFLIFAQKTCKRMERSSVKESNWKVNVFMPKSPLFPCHDVSWGKSAACLVSSRRRAHREQGLEWKFPETLSDLFDQKVGVRQKLKLLILVVKDHAKDIGHTAVNQSSQNWAPFSYLTLYCPIVNENCGPKQMTHHIFYSVRKIAVVQRKKELSSVVK